MALGQEEITTWVKAMGSSWGGSLLPVIAGSEEKEAIVEEIHSVWYLSTLTQNITGYRVGSSVVWRRSILWNK